MNSEVEIVAMVVGSYPPMPCGVGDYTSMLCRHLAARGVRVHVLTSSEASTSPPPPTGIILHADQPGWSLFRLGKVTRMLKDISADVVHIQYPSRGFGKSLGPTFLPSMLEAMDFRPPVVVTIHEFRISHPMRRMASSWLAHYAEGLIFPCAFEMEAFFKRNRSLREVPNRVIPVGSSLPPSPELTPEIREARRKARRSEWGIYDNRPIFLHFGLPSPSKGIDDILLALAKLSREDFDHHLVIAGRFEPEADPFHRLIRSLTMKLGLMSSTTFLGMLPAEEVADVMNACDVGLFPFRDGVSFRRTSWVSALIAGLPTITTEPVAEIPGLHESGIVRVIPRRDVQGLTNAILEIGSNPKILENMRAAENKLKGRFTWPDIASRTIDLYNIALVRRMRKIGNLERNEA